MADVVTLPVYALHIMGAIYFLLTVVIIILVYKKICKRRQTYTTFENDEQYVHKTYHLNDSEAFFVNQLNKKCQMFHDNNKVQYKNNSEESNEMTNIVSSINEESEEPVNKCAHAIDMINSNNPGPTVFIPPNVMEKICFAVLNKNKSKRESSNINEKENNYSGSESCKDKEELDSKLELPDNKLACDSDSDDYDIVPTPKSVNIRISTRYGETEMARSKKNRSQLFRDSTALYKYPITLKMAYVNANILD